MATIPNLQGNPSSDKVYAMLRHGFVFVFMSGDLRNGFRGSS